MATNLIKQRGVALIQVLLLSVIITLLAVQFSYTARNQIEIVNGLNDRLDAKIESYSMMSQLKFAHLSDEVKWYDEIPVNFEQVKLAVDLSTPIELTEHIKIQSRDISGMLSIRYPNHPLWSYYLSALGFDEQAQFDIVNYLTDLQDSDNHSIVGIEPQKNEQALVYLNRPIQTHAEAFNYLASWPTLQAKVGVDIHHYADYEVNLTKASRDLVNAYFGAEVGADINTYKNNPIQHRNNMRNLLIGQFPEETVTVFPSNKKRLTVSVSKGDVLWQETIDVKIDSTSQMPITLIGRLNKASYVF